MRSYNRDCLTEQKKLMSDTFETHTGYNFQRVLSNVQGMTKNMYIFGACVNIYHIDRYIYIVSKGYNAVFFFNYKCLNLFYDFFFDMRTCALLTEHCNVSDTQGTDKASWPLISLNQHNGFIVQCSFKKVCALLRNSFQVHVSDMVYGHRIYYLHCL
mgnify:CR=1 FL=1